MNICLDCNYVNNATTESLTIQVGGIQYDYFLFVGLCIMIIILFKWTILCFIHSIFTKKKDKK
jgi:hypothetical protein